MSSRRFTWGLAACTIVVLIAALPGAVRHALETGDLYMFSQGFLDDLPRRLSGPGRMRFIFQPIVAITLGVLSGKRNVGHQLANLFCLSILLDLASQWLILGVAHPAAALVVGPCLITVPFLVARACANYIRGRTAAPNN
jgi:hypothetical protein